MPDFEDKIPISEFSYTNTLHNTDQAPIIQQDGADWDNFRTSMADIGLHINKDMEYVTDLHTTSKNIIGAINELADGGASADITTEIDTPSSIQTFSDGGDNIPMKSCEVAIVAQQASGTPSPTNPLPITGFSSVALSVGVNLWDEDWEVGSINEQGNTPSTTRIRTKGYIKVIPSNTYYVKAPNNIWVWGYDENKNYKVRIPDTSAISNRTITIPSGVYYIRFVVVDAYGTTYNNDISINYPSTDTAYHHSTTTTVSLGQTIYGGTAELVGGNGSKTWESLTDLANGDWSSQGEGDYQFFALSVSGADTTRLAELLCNKYRTLTPGLTNTDDNIVGIISSGTVLRIRDKRYNATTINDFKTSLSDCIVIFPKATPTAFTFTGANIPTLGNGQINNVYADSGDVNALEYFNEKADDIASMVRLMTRT